VPTAKASFHVPAFQNDYVTLLNVYIPPGRNTGYHVHTLDMVTVIVEDADTTAQSLGHPPNPAAHSPRGRLNFSAYGKQPQTHKVTNVIMRAAIYFTPPADHPLTREAALWLGRDAFTGRLLTGQKAGADWITAEPRRYGFHATLKAPFRLADGRSLAELEQALVEFCRGGSRIEAVKLEIGQLGSFFALIPASENEPIAALAAEIVKHFELFRAPLAPHEIARRKSAHLSATQQRNLEQWGYPYVFEEFRFHMTLTGSIATAQRGPVLAQLQQRFDALLVGPIDIAAIALVVEAEPGADFRVHALYPLQGRRA
jgi:putative phosphonate metabolism protein